SCSARVDRTSRYLNLTGALRGPATVRRDDWPVDAAPARHRGRAGHEPCRLWIHGYTLARHDGRGRDASPVVGAGGVSPPRPPALSRAPGGSPGGGPGSSGSGSLGDVALSGLAMTDEDLAAGAAAPLPPPLFKNVYEIADALYEPDQVAVGVVSMLDLMGIPI